jgi:glycosyltransferase involved in cell wall biosynthesis
VTGAPLRILLASPAYWPARGFGGPVSVARELVRRLVERGHTVDVVTTTLVDLHERPGRRSSEAVVDGATVHYLATPLHYRWMGITPGLPRALERLQRPEVVHVFGFRDPVTTITAAWCRRRGVPYVFEPLGMLRPRLRKVRLKRLFDRTAVRGVPRGAAAVIAVSERERDEIAACGVEPERIVVRGNGFPEPPASGEAEDLRGRLGLPAGTPLVLYAGRIADGKGIDHLLAALLELPELQLVLIGPDDRQGATALVQAALRDSRTSGRVRLLAPSPGPPFDLYRQATLVALPSAGESFGMSAAEAASVGTPILITDRCGVAGFFREGEALVVPNERRAIVEALRDALADGALRDRLAHGGLEAARRNSWDHVTDLQEEIYGRALEPRG